MTYGANNASTGNKKIRTKEHQQDVTAASRGGSVSILQHQQDAANLSKKERKFVRNVNCQSRTNGGQPFNDFIVRCVSEFRGGRGGGSRAKGGKV